MRVSLCLLSLVLAPALSAQSNVQAVYRDGQVFVTFDEGVNPPMTCQVFVSSAPFVLTSQGTAVGRPFRDEWRGKLLRDGAREMLGHDVTWRVPATGGGYRNLAATEGVFVNTVRNSGIHYYAVVPVGATVVETTQLSNAVIQTYDPVGDLVRAHFQFSRTINGFDNFVFAAWRMGDDDAANDRPDFPVTANAAKNGMPYVFNLAQPEGGPGPGPYPLSIALHGGQGHWWQFRPGFFSNIGNRVTSGLMLGPSDDITHNVLGAEEHNMSKWFGWAEDFDPFNPLFYVDPPGGTVIRNYTQRLIDWTIDLLLRPASGLDIDTERISIWGHSAGGRGSSLYSRYRPDRISACYMYTPALEATGEDVPNRLFGSTGLDLETNLSVGGNAVRFWSMMPWHVRLSDSERDLPFTKVWSGKMEFEDGIGPGNHWSAQRVAVMGDCNDSRMGIHVFWDRRDHAVPDWSDEDPANSWVDVGEWITSNPLQRTQRDDTVDEQRYRLHQSFPAFFDSDEDVVTPGRQPDPGNGDPFDGTDFGTWAGYIDWDTATIVDSPKLWSCVVWLTAISPVTVDNYPGPTLKVSLAIRRPQRFHVAPGRHVGWKICDAATGAVQQTGTAVADSQGVVSLTGLTLMKDPSRQRIEVRLLPVPAVRQ